MVQNSFRVCVWAGPERPCPVARVSQGIRCFRISPESRHHDLDRLNWSVTSLEVTRDITRRRRLVSLPARLSLDRQSILAAWQDRRRASGSVTVL